MHWLQCNVPESRVWQPVMGSISRRLRCIGRATPVPQLHRLTAVDGVLSLSCEVRTPAARRPLPARDPLQHRQRGPDVRRGRREAVAGAAAGISRRRLLPAPRGPGLLGTPGVGGRRRLERRCWTRLPSPRHYYFTKTAARAYTDVRFRAGRRAGLRQRVAGPAAVDARRRTRSVRLRIPIRAEARSLNLSNSVAIVVFEARRQWESTGEVGVPPAMRT